MTYFIYLADNPEADLIKVGKTENVTKRIKSLNLPAHKRAKGITSKWYEYSVWSFECSSEATVLERWIHLKLGDYLVAGKEYFRIHPNDAVEIIDNFIT
jgi:hypothetical protein